MDGRLEWLLEGDPSIRWQVERDLLDAPEETWKTTQATVTTEGWGARFLAERSESGLWASGLYSPKWTSTTYTLLQLFRMGLPRDNQSAVSSVGILLDAQIWMFGRGERQVRDDCVAGFALSLSSWFTIDDQRRESLLAGILDQQLPDGGWNCRTARRNDVTHSSFHTTINVLEGLREYVISGGRQSSDVERAESSAREFFCAHNLYRSHRNRHVPDERMTRLPFPPRWHHDILRGLDYFRAADAHRDERLADPVDVLVGYCRDDGTWPIHANYGGKVWFTMEGGRSPSRWNTLRALRVLRWWEG